MASTRYAMSGTLTPKKLAAAGNQLSYVHHPDLMHGFPQFTRSSEAAHHATLDVADHIREAIG